MRVDLFELLDGLFKGIVYFFYNVLETIYIVLRRPFRGPLRLHQAHGNPRVRQISAVTFLFIGFFIFYAFHLSTYELLIYDGGEPTLAGFIASVNSALGRTPSFSLDADALWPVLASTLAATIIFDSLLRLTLRAGLRERRERRQFVLAVVEYAAFPAIALAIVFARFAGFGWQFHVATFNSPGEWPWLFLPPILLALVPAAALLALGLKLRRRIGRATGRRTAAPAGHLFALALIGLFLVVAARTGAALGYRLVGDRSTFNMDPLAFETPVLMSLDCRLSDPQPSVEAVVWNKLDKPVAQEVSQYGLLISDDPDALKTGRTEKESRPVNLALAGDDPPSRIVLGAGEARALRFIAHDYTSAFEDAGRQCGLNVASQLYDPAIEVRDIVD